MKKLYTAAAALTALIAISGSAFAQGTTPGVQSKSMNGKTMTMVSADAPGSIKREAAWAFYNADEREVKRFKAKGFTETEFKAIANIAYRAGVSTDYVARLTKEVGYPLNFIAAWLGVPTDTLTADIPGFNSTTGYVMM